MAALISQAQSMDDGLMWNSGLSVDTGAGIAREKEFMTGINRVHLQFP